MTLTRNKQKILVTLILSAMFMDPSQDVKCLKPSDVLCVEEAVHLLT